MPLPTPPEPQGAFAYAHAISLSVTSPVEKDWTQLAETIRQLHQRLADESSLRHQAEVQLAATKAQLLSVSHETETAKTKAQVDTARELDALRAERRSLQDQVSRWQ